MSGLVDNGRDSGRGNIDVNDPNRKSRLVVGLPRKLRIDMLSLHETREHSVT